MPSWILDFDIQEKDNSYELFKFGNTSVVTTPVLRFLNTKEHITIELYLKLVSKKPFNLSCSMISDGAIHKTDKYKEIDTNELLKSKSGTPYPIEGKLTSKKDLFND